MERVKTGIKALDSLFSGGFVKNSISLISGAPGTGKTIFSLSYIYSGANKLNEVGFYVTFEQPKKHLFEQALQFGWDLEKLEKQNKIHILYIPIEKIHKETLNLISDLVVKYEATRLVIDSLSTLNITAPQHSNVNSKYETRYFIYKFIDELRKLNCTTLLTTELRHEDWLGEDTSAEFVVDTVILLKYFGAKGASSRTLAIKKARRTEFDERIHPFKFTKNGIKIFTPRKLAMSEF